MQKVISLDTEKLARRGFQHEGLSPPTHTHALKKHWGGGWVPRLPGPDAYELLKTPSHRLVRSQYCGIVSVKEEGPWRDLEICVSPKVGGGAETSFHPLSLESGGGECPLNFPPCSYAYDCQSREWTSRPGTVAWSLSRFLWAVCKH